MIAAFGMLGLVFTSIGVVENEHYFYSRQVACYVNETRTITKVSTTGDKLYNCQVRWKVLNTTTVANTTRQSDLFDWQTVDRFEDNDYCANIFEEKYEIDSQHKCWILNNKHIVDKPPNTAFFIVGAVFDGITLMLIVSRIDIIVQHFC